MKNKGLPSSSELREIFSYCDETGLLTRRSNAQEIKGPPSQPYVQVAIEGSIYSAHTVIWKMIYGEHRRWIDHINGDGRDNRLCNLRAATPAQNRWNSRIGRRNKSGVKGVCWESSRRKWRMSIATNGELIVRRFDRLEDAQTAIAEIRRQMHGDFARVA